MVPVSVVVISKNEEEIIASCINAAKLISGDIIIIDNDSTDKTTAIALASGCRVYHENWDGYGVNKNKGIACAKHDWILSIDADEIPDEELVRSLHDTVLDDPTVVYDIAFKSYFGYKAINFGSWGRDHHVRLFNRTMVKWSESPVHETLVLPQGIRVKKLSGRIHHYSAKNETGYQSKAARYARLCAEKYFAEGKKATSIKLFIAPLFHFLKNYVVFLGFMDGREGFIIATTIARHTRLKYRLLQQMTKRNYAEPAQIKDNFAVEY